MSKMQAQEQQAKGIPICIAKGKDRLEETRRAFYRHLHELLAGVVRSA